MKIAIIGSGIAGLTSAYYLHQANHEVHVFEANDYIGGHTHTVDVTVKGEQHAIDTGFIVLNDWTYPNFQKLLRELNVATQPTEMSFSVCDKSADFEYSGSHLNGLFATRRHLYSPSFWRMLRDIMRFNRDALADLEAQRIDADISLGQYLKERGYSQLFVERYIVPMGAAIWSMPTAQMLGFPLLFFVRFFKNHGLLSINNRPQWHVIKGGSRSYIEPLTAGFKERIYLNAPVSRVERNAQGVTIISPRGSEAFDAVVMACHSNTALQLLTQPSMTEQAVLSALPYANNEVVLHTDTNLLPNRHIAWASWNYNIHDAQQGASLTYNMNILQGIKSDTTFCVSLNQTEHIAADKILATFQYAHPQFSLDGVTAQARWAEISGVNHTYFCGAYWANGFHEDGVVSALRVVEQLKARS